jgi:hypothetical protein
MRASQRLHDIYRGGYALGHRVLSQRSCWLAAVLACGPDALLSHRCAAALANVRRTSLTYAGVIVSQQRGGIDGVRIYVSGRIHPQDRDTIDGIACTSLARTLPDVAAILPRREVERACDEALASGCGVQPRVAR